MEFVAKTSETRPDQRSGSSRWRKLVALVHPGAIVATSLILAGGIFLTGSELQSLVGSNAALYKLVAGSALISVLGIFFAQHVIIWASANERDARFMDEAEEYSDMKEALDKQVNVAENSSDYEKFCSDLRRRI